MNKRILIIEDHGDLARILAMHLRELSSDVDRENDGPAGLERSGRAA